MKMGSLLPHLHYLYLYHFYFVHFLVTVIYKQLSEWKQLWSIQLIFQIMEYLTMVWLNMNIIVQIPGGMHWHTQFVKHLM